MTTASPDHANAVPPVRPGFPTVSPYLVFKDPEPALEFYHRALGAIELSRLTDEAGRIRHAEMRIVDSTLMLTTTNPDYPFMRSVDELGASPVQFFLYVESVEARFQRAIDAGAEVVMPIAEQAFGRCGGFKDPFGIIWWLSTHREPPKSPVSA